MKTVIRGGTIVTAADVVHADLLIADGKIEMIGENLVRFADEEIDASGKIVIPGGIDPHTHLDMPTRSTQTSDDFETGTIAAAAGGTTTIIDFAMQEKGQSLFDVLDIWHKKAEGKAVIDYSFHMMIGDLSGPVMDEIVKLPEAGVTSLKVFLAYKHTLQVDDQTLFQSLLQSGKSGTLVAVHCENGDVIDTLVNKALSDGRTDPLFHAITRPPDAEGEATQRAIALASIAGVPIYIVHVSCKEALEQVIRARTDGKPVYAETCVHYLVLDESAYSKPGFEGAKYVCSPPLRAKHHQEHLWSGLKNGFLQTLASDHCPFCYKEQKELGKGNFSLIPNGVPGIEDRMTVFYTAGVRSGKISVNQFVDITSTRSAKIFGLYPKKGTIAAGADADLVIWDPEKEKTVSAQHQHQRVDYNLFEGMKVKGVPAQVLSRGKTIIKENEFVGSAGWGKFVPRAVHTRFHG
jgi:dihydropyrimidinase